MHRQFESLSTKCCSTIPSALASVSVSLTTLAFKVFSSSTSSCREKRGGSSARAPIGGAWFLFSAPERRVLSAFQRRKKAPETPQTWAPARLDLFLGALALALAGAALRLQCRQLGHGGPRTKRGSAEPVTLFTSPLHQPYSPSRETRELVLPRGSARCSEALASPLLRFCESERERERERERESERERET